MALTLTRKILVRGCFLKSSYPLRFFVTSAARKTVFVSNSFGKFRVSYVLCAYSHLLNLQCFCSSSVQQEKLSWEGSSREVLLRKLESASKNHQAGEAWETFNDFQRLHGIPERHVVNRFIIDLCYSAEPHWLQKACDLVLKIQKGKADLLQLDLLAKLSLSLARAQMPVPASMILRLMLGRENLPRSDLLSLVFVHMVKTEIGTCLASNFLIQLCDVFLHLSAEKSNGAELIKPDTMIFNLVLHACVRFGSSLKGQHIMELMSQTGVVADAHSIIILAQIHEMNCQRDELKKFKCYIDQLSTPFAHHYQQFYESLLSLHFKFDDIDAAGELILDMNRYREPLPNPKLRQDAQKPYLISIGSPNLRCGLKLQIMPELLEKDSILKMEGKQELVLFRNGKLLHSNRAMAKLINGYKKHGKNSELSGLLLSIKKEHHSFGESTLCSDVIDALIQLGFLEAAHDILDDMEFAGHPMDSTTYKSLLTAYYKVKMFREAEALLKQMRKSCLVQNLSCEMIVSERFSEVADKSASFTDTSSLMDKSDLAESLIQEMREEAALSMIYKLNSSIYFFCKGKMIGDALKIYRRMQEMKIRPTVETFYYLVYGYSSLEMYRDITILWGDIKRNIESGVLAVSRDLYETLLLNFLQGGYFERVMEVIGYMKKQNMYVDKLMYKSEFLKHHKHLYRRLKVSNARTEAQSKRLVNVQAFRKWAGID
ncbi:pentatricopeptide repeat-containing protein [Citrus sinensis]|uniref:pentatricopeptide repeat-containing protein At4g17616 isoform X1 n=1 Tax=Citrus sinensis TaxID=2711 RepID=UPI0003D6F26F|nr:pentatricopeptide repeat-containing protein At4g17616 isoform X1 [Citrus sinensis]XP_006480450.1 pentatricopeptide repeat-containing protein At4g17616 isoform X1 [Citrus sinensis]KAH9670695.1 pentatricopeptide repeat-containing protein [Citrus sinensis]